MKAGRLLGILHYLLAHGRIPARILAQRFEVTERTILRDMDDLSEFGVPVYAIQGQGGGWEIDRRYVLPAGLLQEQEQSQILAALEASQADDGLLDKLKAHFKGSQKADHWLLVDQTTWHQSSHLSHDFDLLKQAILESLGDLPLLFQSGYLESTSGGASSASTQALSLVSLCLVPGTAKLSLF